MYSQTFVGRDIFASVWGLTVLSAAATCSPLRFPFDSYLRGFAAEHDGALAALWGEIQRFTCLDDDVMRIASDEAPWMGSEDKYPDANALKMELVLGDPDPERFVGTDVFQTLSLDREHLQTAIMGQLVRLVDGLLSGHWAFCGHAQAGHPASPESVMSSFLRIFSRLGSILRGAGLETEHRHLLTLALRGWRQSRKARGAVEDDTPAAFRRFLDGVTRHVDDHRLS